MSHTAEEVRHAKQCLLDGEYKIDVVRQMLEAYAALLEQEPVARVVAKYGHWTIIEWVEGGKNMSREGMKLYTSPQPATIPPGYKLVRTDVIDFLLGTTPLDGKWFGERLSPKGGMYWWRKYLHQSAAPEVKP